MSMSEEMLEILISRYLDGEISPGERQQLQAEIDANAQARTLLEQMQELDRCSRKAIGAAIQNEGGGFDGIFERAWSGRKTVHKFRLFALDARLRFATGLAAGLVLGLILHFALAGIGHTQGAGSQDTLVAQSNAGRNELQPAVGEIGEAVAPVVGRNIDWYSFTDDAGNQWVLEGLRQNYVRPAAYGGGL